MTIKITCILSIFIAINALIEIQTVNELKTIVQNNTWVVLKICADNNI